MILRRPEPEPDPDPELAAHEIEADPELAAALPDEPTALAVEVRPPLREVLPRWLATLGAVGAIVGLLYFLATPEGRSVVDERGALAVAGGWLLFLALVLAGGLAGIAISRGVSAGQRPLRRGTVVRHVLGESIAAGVGAVVVAMAGAMAWPDVMRVLAFTLVLVTLFTWAVLMPASAARFEEHARS